jgi:hypothetical protein
VLLPCLCLEVVEKFLDMQMHTEDSKSLPYFQQKSTLMVNIVSRMRQELEKNNRGMGERHGNGLGGWGTILHWSNMNVL